MKKSFILSIALCLCAICGVRAQVVKNGTKWWDGKALYTATVDQDGDVVMNGITQADGNKKFCLSKAEGEGMYYLAKDNPKAVLPVRGKMGSKVEYVRKDGMNFLAIRNRNNETIYTLVLTPDNLPNCANQQRDAEMGKYQDRLLYWLMNTAYLSKFSKDQLRMMRNEILARHGWKFQAKDLQDYFDKQTWYSPVANNSQIKLSVIENTNMQLIKNEETIPDEERGYVDYSSGPAYNEDLRAMVDGGDFEGGLADDGRGPDEVEDGAVIVVKHERGFLNALGNNRTIVIAKDAHLNLSRVLENEDEFKMPGRKWCVDAEDFSQATPLIISESESDGQQLALANFKNLTIKGEGHSSIEVDPRYSFVIRFVNCTNCVVENLTMGHTEGGFCSGGVIGARQTSNLTVKDCDLYGCGTYGVDLWEAYNFKLVNSNIHDCTYGIIQLHSCTLTSFEKCDFFNNREYGLIEGWGNQGVKFEDCRIFANWGDSQLFFFDSVFSLINCKIYHPKQNLGTMDKSVNKGSKFIDNPLDTSITSRGIGPDQNN